MDFADLVRTSLIGALTLGCVDHVAPPAPLEPTGPPLTAAPPPPTPVVEASARIAAVGDIMMHGMVQKSARVAAGADPPAPHGGFSALFDEVAPALRRADIAFGNLETPIAPKHGTGVRPMVFNAPPVLLTALHDAGFDIVSFANNHVYDQGVAGFTETLEQLDASPLAHAGGGSTCEEAKTPVVLTVNGLKIAFLAASDLYNDQLNAGPKDPCSFVFDTAQIIAAASGARTAGADAVVLSVHWGSEYQVVPHASHVTAARAIIDGGVDLILGHHPHVLQPVETWTAPDGRIGVIAFSLGNFVSNQSAWYRHGSNGIAAGNPRDGALLEVDVVRRAYPSPDGPVHRIELDNLSVWPLWTDNNTQVGRGKDPVRIEVVPTATALAAALKAGDDARAELLGDRLDQVQKVVGPMPVRVDPTGPRP